MLCQYTYGRMQKDIFCSLQPCLGLVMARVKAGLKTMMLSPSGPWGSGSGGPGDRTRGPELSARRTCRRQ